MTSLMAVHAAHQLVQTDELFVCLLYDYSPETIIPLKKASKGRVNWDMSNLAGKITWTSPESLSQCIALEN